MKNWWGFVMLSTLSLASASGCVCKEMYNPSGIVVAFEVPLPQAGLHEIKVQSTTGVPAFVTCVLDYALENPRAGCDSRGEPAVTAFGPSEIFFSFAGDPPAQVTISVQSDDRPPEVTTHSLSYQTSEPNGRGCGEQSTARISL